MKTHNTWAQRILGVAPLLVLGSACSDDASDAPRAPSSVLERYVEQFRRDNPYVDHSITRGPHRLAAREFRASAASSGPPIVLLHGYPDSQHLYDRVVPLLRASRDVVTFDFLGWGDSDKPAVAEHDYTAQSLRDDLETVLAHFGWNDVVLVVHDASGWPGIDWALDHPERVASLIVLNTVYHPVDAGRPPEGLAQYAAPGPARDALVARVAEDDTLWLEGSISEGVIGFRDQIGRFFSNAAARDAHLPVFVEQSLAMRPAFFELASVLIAEVTARASAIPRMAAFDRPVSIVFGADDPYLNLEVAADFTLRFPNRRRIDIAGANHYVQMDRPDQVATAILTNEAIDP